MAKLQELRLLSILSLEMAPIMRCLPLVNCLLITLLPSWGSLRAQQPAATALITLSGSGMQPYLAREMPNGKTIIACQTDNSISLYDYNSTADTNTQQFTGTNLSRQFVAVVNQQGHVEWVKYIRDGTIQDIAMDSANNIYLVGNYQDYLITSSKDTVPLLSNNNNLFGDIFVMSLTADGHTRWMRTSDNGAIDQYEPSATYIKSDGKGNVYVSGIYDRYINFGSGMAFFRNAASDIGFIPFLIGLDSAGNYLFAHDWNSETGLPCGLTLDSCRVYVSDDDGASGTNTRIRVFDFGGRLLRKYTIPFFGGNYEFNNFQIKNDRVLMSLDTGDNKGSRRLGYISISGQKLLDIYLQGVTLTYLDFTTGGNIFFAGDIALDSSTVVGRMCYNGTVFGEFDTTGNLKWMKNIRHFYSTTNALTLSATGKIHVTTDVFGQFIINNSTLFDSTMVTSLEVVDSNGVPTGLAFRILGTYLLQDSAYISHNRCSSSIPPLSCIDREGYQQVQIPMITISGDTAAVTAGTSININSTIAWGGDYPLYKWQDSSSAHGWETLSVDTIPTLNYTPLQAGDKMRCLLISSLACANPDSVFSNTISFTVKNPGTIFLPGSGKGNIRIFPNPATDLIIIDSLSGSGWQMVDLLDVEGRLVATYNLENKASISIDIGNLAFGIYFLRFWDQHGASYVKKVLKYSR